jgi:hypothetical protein
MSAQGSFAKATFKIWVKRPLCAWAIVPGDYTGVTANTIANRYRQKYPDRTYKALPLGESP